MGLRPSRLYDRDLAIRISIARNSERNSRISRSREFRRALHLPLRTCAILAPEVFGEIESISLTRARLMKPLRELARLDPVKIPSKSRELVFFCFASSFSFTPLRKPPILDVGFLRYYNERSC